MGRPSKLNEKQWDDIKRRLATGEKAADLSREYGVSRATISERCQKPSETIRDVANQLVSADSALRSLPISEQAITLSVFDELRAISGHLAGAAKYGAATAHRLSGIAHAKVQEIDDAAPLTEKSMESLKGVAVLTRLANDASVIGVSLLSANKDRMKEAEEKAAKRSVPAGLGHFYGQPG